MDGFFITVKSDLLEQKHVDAMRVSNKTSAIWMYLWFLDKITEIDQETHLGIVLGGKPLKLDDIGVIGDIKTKRKVFRCLVDNGYIVTNRTTYGQIVCVTKAFKIFGQKYGSFGQKSGRSGIENVQNLVGLGSKSGRSGFPKPARGGNREELDSRAIFSDKTIRQKEINKESYAQAVDKNDPGYLLAKATAEYIKQKPGVPFEEWYKVKQQPILTGGQRK